MKQPITFLKLNVAILGNTKLSELLALSLAFRDYNIYYGCDSKQQKKPALLQRYRNIYFGTIEDTAAASDVIIIASLPRYVRELAYYIDDVHDKVVIDMSSFFTDHETINLNTLQAIKVITGSEQVVKCYGALKHHALSVSFTSENVQELFLAGDNKKSKVAADMLFRDLGIEICHDIGNDTTACLVDEAIAYNTDKG